MTLPADLLAASHCLQRSTQGKSRLNRRHNQLTRLDELCYPVSVAYMLHSRIIPDSSEERDYAKNNYWSLDRDARANRQYP